MSASPLELALAVEPSTTIDHPQLFTDQSFAPRADQTAGAHIERVALNIPPGRNGLTPDLALAYNSQDLTDGIAGYGWSLSIPYIERLNRTGSENLYTDNYFSSSLGGELATTTTANEYRHRIEDGRFITYTFANNTWVAYDKSGTRYLFGTTTQAQQSATTSPSDVYRWMLEEVRDTNDSFVRYVYAKDGNQIYPSQIIYTGNGAEDGVFTIDITKSARPDTVISYKSGFKVTTDYRITEIKASVDSTWVRKWTLSYVSGANGARSLLSSVQETGRDDLGSELSLPAQTFAYSSSTPSYVEHTNPRIWNSARVVGDGDGNGLPDRLIFRNNTGTLSETYRSIDENEYPDFNSSNTQTTSEYWTYSNGTGANEYPPIERGTRLFDLNGDGRADIFKSFKNSDGTFTREYSQSTSPFTWTGAAATGTLPTFGCKSGSDTYSTGLFGNLNGDGLTDYIAAIPYCSVSGAYLNTGTTTGWTLATSTFSAVANMPTSFSDTSSSELVDINGDGLDDWMHSSGGETRFYLNTGTGWPTYDPLWTIATSTRDGDGYDRGIRFFDANGDGLADYVRSYNMSTCSPSPGSRPCPDVGTYNYVYLNTGSGFATSSLELPAYIFNATYGAGGFWYGAIDYDEAVDWNGDGIPDLSGNTSTSTATAKPDVLVEVTYPSGGSTEIQYKYSAQLGTNADLAFPVLVVTKVTKRDNLGNAEVTAYGYEGGRMYLAGDVRDRRFATFKTITKTDALGKTKTYFNQGDEVDTASGEQTDSFAQIGRSFREDIISLASTTMKTTFTKWNTFDQGSGRGFVYRESELVEHYDGDADHRDVATEYTYATTTGNLTQVVERGEVNGSGDGTYADTGTDTVFKAITYAASSTVNLSVPTQEIVTNYGSTTVKESKFSYDNLAFGSVGKGNVTKRENWISGGIYASTTKAYNAYGLVTSETDPRGNTTSYTHDPYNLYVGTSTNALSQTTGYLYDYATGKARQVTDANSRTRKAVFDPVGRLKETIAPDPSTGSLVTQSLFTYTDNVFPRKVQETRYLGSATSTDIYSYFDGLGRVVQERTESADAYAAKDRAYGSHGMLSVESLPYFSSGSDWTAATTTTNLLLSYEYDALRRVASSTNVTGTETHAFDQWKETVTDRNGNPKDLISDAYGNLANVVEYDDGSPATTTYSYDALNNLTKITDALGNIRNFAYDGLSRVTSSEDLHALADGTFGSTTYAYDAAGNITSRTDPKSQVVDWTYDALNRVLTEDYTGGGGTEVQYGYDWCTDGKGRICAATTTDAVTTYAYNALGLPSSETRTLESADYTTLYAYDRRGNITDITYPDESIVRYGYNSAGQVETVLRKPADQSEYLTAIGDIDYGPTGAITYKQFGNGVESFYTFDATELYRLKRIVTTASTTWSGGGALALLGGPGEGYPWSALALASPQLHAIATLDGDLLLEEAHDFPEEATPTNAEEDTSSASSTPENGAPGTTTPETTEEPVATSTLTQTEGASSDASQEAATTTEPILEAETSSSTASSLVSDVASSTEPTEVPLSDTGDAATTTEEFLAETTATSTPHVPTSPVAKLLIGKSPEERATIKGAEIAKLGALPKQDRGSFSFEVVSMEPIEGGVEAFVRAWKGEKQIGFGSDGTVDIERFRIFNPPILVPDDNGDILQEWEEENPATNVKEKKSRRLREDVQEALLQVIEHNLSVMKNIHTDERIVKGKRGNTTSTFYPSGDGQSGTYNQSSDWDTEHDRTVGNNLSNSGETLAVGYLRTNVSGTNIGILRWFLMFDTSAIADADYIDSATLSLYLVEKSAGSITGESVLVQSTPASYTVLVDEDYDQNGAVDDPTEGANRFDADADWTTSAYNNIVLNATGRGWISTTGHTGFGIRNVADATDADPGSGVSADINSVSSSDETGTTQDPKLVVEHYALGGSETGSSIQDISYVYDAVGNVTLITDYSTSTIKVLTLAYDDLHRLLSASTTAASSTPYRHQYAYNALGNMLGMATSVATTTYTYNDDGYNNPHATDSVGGINYSYDNNGNLTAAGATTYEWDYRNRLLEADNGAATAYAYDHTVQRVTKTAGGETTVYPNKYFEKRGATTTASIFLPNGEIIATIEGNGTASTTNYIHGDHLGSTNVVTDENGDVVQVLDYYPFGSERIDTGTDVSQRQYIGEVFDEETEMSYLNARYLQNERGQFASQDPTHLAIGNPGAVQRLTGQSISKYLADPQQLNSYSYARNNPIVYKDPAGNTPLLAAPVIIGGVAGATFAIGQQAYTDIYNGQFSGVRNYGIQGAVGAAAGAGVVYSAAVSPFLAAGMAFYGAYTSSVAGDAFNQYNVSGEIDQTKAISQGVMSIATMGLGKLIPGIPGAYPKVNTLVNNFSQNPIRATSNFFFSAHGQRDILQQLSNTLGALLVELNRLQGGQNADSKKALPPAQSQKKTANRRRRKSATDTIYEPNQKWLLQGFLFLGFFPLFVMLLSSPREAIFIAMAFSLVLEGVMFFAISRYSYITLTAKTLSQKDLFRQRTITVSGIEMIRKTKEGFFGDTRIKTDKSEVMLNQAIFDEETINDLIEDLQKLNPAIRIEES